MGMPWRCALQCAAATRTAVADGIEAASIASLKNACWTCRRAVLVAEDLLRFCGRDGADRAG